MKMLDCHRQWRVWEGASALVMCQLLDAYGTPIDPAAIEWLAATLYEPRSSTIINGREQQDVLATNGGELLPNLSVTDVAATNPVVVTTSQPHGLSSDPETPWRIFVDGLVGPETLNGRSYDVQVTSDRELALTNKYGKLLPEYTSGGTIRTGMLRLQLTPADMLILDSTVAPGEAEEHRLVIEFGYNGGQTGAAVIRIDVIRAR